MVDLYFGVVWSLRNDLKMGISFVWAVKVFGVMAIASLEAHYRRLGLDRLPRVVMKSSAPPDPSLSRIHPSRPAF